MGTLYFDTPLRKRIFEFFEYCKSDLSTGFQTLSMSILKLEYRISNLEYEYTQKFEYRKKS
jgi:hypothetical protein